MMIGFIIILFNIKKISIKINTQTILILMIFQYSLISLILNIKNINSINMFLGLGLFTFYFLTLNNIFINSKFKLIKLIDIGIIVSLLSLIYYLYGFLELTNLNSSNPISYGLLFDRGMPRFKGFSNNPDYINLFILPFFFTSLIFFKNNYRAKFLFLLCLIQIILSFSLSSIFTYFIIASFYFFINILNFKKIIKLSAFIFFLIFSFYLIIDNSEPISEIFTKRMTHLETGSGRFNMWGFAFEKFKLNPIFGNGIGSIKSISLDKFDISNLHNYYLEILFEEGIIGLCYLQDY